MTRILWDAIGSRHFSAGVDRGVLYLQNGSGVPWNGLVNVNEAPSGADVVDNYYDGQKFFSRRQPEEYAATIEAFTHPVEFDEFDGRGRYVTDQRRKTFGFSYRTLLGNDIEGTSFGYLIHIVYDAIASPSARSHKTVSSSADLNLFSWGITTSHRELGGRSGSHLIIDSTIAYPWVIQAIEDLLYGSASTAPRLPDPQEILDLFEEGAILKIIDHGDGTWTAIGPDDVVYMTDPDTFEINWPSVVYLDEDTYQVSSL